jgi:hypothetical protein
MLIIGMTSGTLAAVATAGFSDVTDEYPYVTALQKAGVVVGYEGRFNGEGTPHFCSKS